MARPQVKNESKKVTFNLETDLMNKLRKYADKKGWTLTRTLENFIREGIKKD